MASVFHYCEVGTFCVLMLGIGLEQYLCASKGRNVDHVDVDDEIEALWLDSSPVLIGQRSVQVDDRLHIAQLVVSSVRFYTENGNKRRC